MAGKRKLFRQRDPGLLASVDWPTGPGYGESWMCYELQRVNVVHIGRHGHAATIDLVAGTGSRVEWFDHNGAISARENVAGKLITFTIPTTTRRARRSLTLLQKWAEGKPVQVLWYERTDGTDARVRIEYDDEFIAFVGGRA